MDNFDTATEAPAEHRGAVLEAVAAIGGQRATARQLGVTQGAVWQWCNGKRPLPAAQALAMYHAARGLVSPHRLCPKVFADPDYLPPIRAAAELA